MNRSEKADCPPPGIHHEDHARILVSIKLLHSAVWVFMTTCIVLIPLAALRGLFRISAVLCGMIMLECVVLLCNQGKCPLTSAAAQFTENRADNFDIFLPLWLARHNKAVFGTLFVCGSGFALLRWLIAR